jgi:hypothetical protein
MKSNDRMSRTHFMVNSKNREGVLTFQVSLKVASSEFKHVHDFDKGSPGHGSHRPTHVTTS